MVFIAENIHILIHAKDERIIDKYCKELDIKNIDIDRLIKLREKAGNCEIIVIK